MLTQLENVRKMIGTKLEGMFKKVDMNNISVISQASLEDAERMIGKKLRVKTANPKVLVKVICESIDVCDDRIVYVCKSGYGHVVRLYRSEFDILPQK